MFVTKEDLKKLGFGNYQAYSLIKQAKALLTIIPRVWVKFLLKLLRKFWVQN